MNDLPPKIIKSEPWLVNLRENNTTSESNSSENIRFITATQQDPVITVVDNHGDAYLIGLDGKPRDFESMVDTTPCSCDEYRKQGIEEGWIDE